MSFYLRILLIVMSVLAAYYCVHKIRKSQMKIDNAIFWVIFIFIVLVLSFFPELAMILARLLGIESPVNLIYLIMISLLLIKVFSQSVKISQMEYRIGILTQETAINKKKIEEKANTEVEVK